MQKKIFRLLKLHIGALIAEKLTVKQKYPDRKSINMANNYTENEYTSYLLIVKSLHPKNENSLLSKVEDI